MFLCQYNLLLLYLAFVDIVKAFDGVDWTKMFIILKNTGCKERIIIANIKRINVVIKI